MGTPEDPQRPPHVALNLSTSASSSTAAGLRYRNGKRPSLSTSGGDVGAPRSPGKPGRLGRAESVAALGESVTWASEMLGRLKKVAEEDRQEFSKLQDAVWESIGEHEVMEASFERQFETERSFGETAADSVASWGGSWNFVIGFTIVVLVWTVTNSSLGPDRAWDPYPYILLNLFLSTLAAFQAPVIMMSQNRQAALDRAQSDYTARVNLRAELMTRHINAKLDALLSSAWRRLLESQAIQTVLLERVVELSTASPVPPRAEPQAQSASPFEQIPTMADVPAGMQLAVYDPAPEEGEGALVDQVSPNADQEVDAYQVPLAALCLAPPSARLCPGQSSPWQLETEEDEHTLFLLRAMLGVKMDAAPDDAHMVFEHRLSNFGDNFVGWCSNIRLSARDPSLLTKDVRFCLPPSASSSSSFRGRMVSPAFVAQAVEVASLVDTGGGAECTCPFDLTYDINFSEGAVLDSILAGDGIVSLRNALDLGSMTATGQIRRMVLHPRGCPCSLAGPSDQLHGLQSRSYCDLDRTRCEMAVEVENGEVPARFKPSLSKDRQDRISDFWKTPLARLEVSYSPADILACVTLRAGQTAAPIMVEFVNPNTTGQGEAGPELMAIINPSAELLCRAMAMGFVPPPGCAASKGYSDQGEAPLRLSEQSGWEKSPLPHNMWMALPLDEASENGWTVSMPNEVEGPACLFLYSPDGRLRLRGFLRDYGAQELQGL